MQAPYTKYLTPAERISAIKFGALNKLASLGINPFSKQADLWPSGIVSDISDSASRTMSILIGLAAMTGIPTGILLHSLGQNLSRDRGRERELNEKIKYYKGLTHNIESELKSPVGLDTTPGDVPVTMQPTPTPVTPGTIQ